MHWRFNWFMYLYLYQVEYFFFILSRMKSFSFLAKNLVDGNDLCFRIVVIVNFFITCNLIKIK